YLLGQKGGNKSISDTAYKLAVQEWEMGLRKTVQEKAFTPEQIHDLRNAMTVFATQGCASCHRLKGFQSDIGFSIEKESKEKVSFDALYREREWFRTLFPETITGTKIVKVLEKHAEEI